MSYSVKEIFYTLQGEGGQAGMPAVFCRFAGCNLWSGRESDRENAICRFCDTDFVGTDGTLGGKFASAGQLADVVLLAFSAGTGMQNSMVAPMAIANALLNGMAALKGTSALERYNRHDRLMNRWDAFLLKPDGTS